MDLSEDFSEFADNLGLDEIPEPKLEPKPMSVATSENPGDGLDDFLASSDVKLVDQEQKDDLVKPWMRYHKFVLVKTVDQVREVVNKAIENGSCSLDTETEGLDTRVDFDSEGKPHTKHRIVGYCISVRGVGYYIPIRHLFNSTYGEADPNVTPIEEVDAEIKRLCLASQPKLTAAGLAEDPLSSMKMEVKPRVVIAFFHAKFDHEMLYPVTGIEWWHPSSFEDAMLAAYCVDTSDNSLNLKDKAKRNLSVVLETDKGMVEHPYEMIEFEELFKKKRTSKPRIYNLYPQDGNPVVLYGCSDAICTELLIFPNVKVDYAEPGAMGRYRNVLEPCLKSHSSGYKLEKQVSQAVRIMERSRVRIDKTEVSRILEEAKDELDKYERLICTLAEEKGFQNFNPGSPSQLGEFLFEEKGLDITPKPDKTDTGQYKTDANTLEKLAGSDGASEVLDWIIKFRQIDKIIGTYLTNMVANCDDANRLRFSFKQTGAATGRFSAPGGESEEGYAGVPPQGIPARVDPKRPKCANSLRRAFVASDGYTWVKVDYAGQELRIAANLSQEEVWIKEFLEGDGDLHTITAKAFFPGMKKSDPDFKDKRQKGKTANFALIYGGGTGAVQAATKCSRVEAARRKLAFDKAVPTYTKWVNGQKALVKKIGGVRNAFGRFLAIPEVNVKVGEVSYGRYMTERDVKGFTASAERKASNFPIQGTGADILKISLVKLSKELMKRGWLRSGDDSVRMLMTVHDEIVFEIKHERLQDAIPLIRDIMVFPSEMLKWRVPLTVEPLIGRNWEAKYDWDKVLTGEEPVPDWLVGHVVVNGQNSEKKLSTSEPKPAPTRESPTTTTIPQRTFEDEPVVGAPNAMDVVAFMISPLTRNRARILIGKIYEAYISGTLNGEAQKLVLYYNTKGKCEPLIGLVDNIEVDATMLEQVLEEYAFGQRVKPT